MHSPTARVYQSLTARLARSGDDFEAIRQIRNEGRRWMEDQRHISRAEQEVFRRTFLQPITVFVLEGKIVGWGLHQEREAKRYVSLAVHPEWRGQGIGKMIYRYLRKQYPTEPLYARIRVDNVASRRAAEHAGFLLLSEDEEFVTMWMPVW